MVVVVVVAAVVIVVATSAAYGLSAVTDVFTRFLAKDPGTFWWHSHAGLQRSNGLFGHLVVRQPPSRDPHSALYDYDLPEHVMSVTDWLVEMTANRFAAHHHESGDNQPASMLINGEVFKILRERLIFIYFIFLRVQEPCESRGGRPGLPVLMSLMVSVDVKQH